MNGKDSIKKGWTIIFLLVLTTTTSQTDIALTTYSDNEVAKCTGSANCRACKNCKYCKHCNGGSCGVCSGGSRRTSTESLNYNRSRTYSPPSTSSHSSTSSYPFKSNSTTSTSPRSNYTDQRTYYLPDDPYSQFYLKTLTVNTEALNLRNGPGTKYGILEKQTKYQELVFLAMTGEWIKVRAKSSNRIGFVHYKYIVVLTE